MSATHPTQPRADLSDAALLEFCRALVRIPSLSGDEQAAAGRVTEQLRTFGFSPVQDDFGNIIVTFQGQAPGPTLLFDAHLDVVPAGDPAAWTHPPFRADVGGGRIWGRGSADTKGSAAAMIWSLARLLQTSQRAPNAFAGKVIFAATVCEENLTGAAIGAILDASPVDLMVTGEPTELRLGIAQKGRATLCLEAVGRSAHTSTPWAGDNAVYKMLVAIQRLRDLPQPGDPDLGPAILELTEIISEPYPNGLTVPHGCRARLIARLLPGESAASFLERIQVALADLPGVRAGLGTLEQTFYTGKTVRVEDFIPGWRLPPESPWIGAVLPALRQAGLPAEILYAPCGTNASAAAARGIASLIYGPGRLEDAHTVDESLSIQELSAAARGFETILSAVLHA